jgi:hypothetical protein
VLEVLAEKRALPNMEVKPVVEHFLFGTWRHKVFDKQRLMGITALSLRFLQLCLGLPAIRPLALSIIIAGNDIVYPQSTLSTLFIIHIRSLVWPQAGQSYRLAKRRVSRRNI